MGLPGACRWDGSKGVTFLGPEPRERALSDRSRRVLAVRTVPLAAQFIVALHGTRQRTACSGHLGSPRVPLCHLGSSLGCSSVSLAVLTVSSPPPALSSPTLHTHSEMTSN